MKTSASVIAGLTIAFTMAGSMLVNNVANAGVALRGTIHPPSVPHAEYEGEINGKKVDAFIKELESAVKTTGKKSYFYVFLNSIGGEVDAGEKLDKKIEELKAQGYKIRLMITKLAASKASDTAVKFSGPRFIEEGAHLVFHAPYVKKSDETECKMWESCMDKTTHTSLNETLNEFAENIARTSCVLNKQLALQLLTNRGTNEDNWIDVSTALKYNLVDFVYKMSKGKWPKITQRFNPADCEKNRKIAEDELNIPKLVIKPTFISTGWATRVTPH